jgi:hypothetical protein
MSIKTKKFWVEGTGFLCDGIIFTSDDKNECISFANQQKGKYHVREDGFVGSNVVYKNY